MANQPIPTLPVAVTLDGTEQMELVQPAGNTGTSKRATTLQIGNLANIGSVSLGIVNLQQLGFPDPTLDFLAILHSDGKVYKINPSGLSQVSGNVPAGGTISQFLIKESSSNYDAIWATMTGDVSMSGTSTFAATIATAAVTYAKFQQVAGLSVVGVSGSSTAVAGAIAGTTDQVLRVEPNGTTLGFGQVNLSSLAAITGTLNITAFLSGIVSVPLGGSGTSALTAFGVIIGNGTSAVTVATAGTAGQLFIGQTSTSQPSFKTIGGDITVTAPGTATIANGAVTYAKIQQVGALSILGNGSSASATAAEIAGTANQVLRVNSGGTTVAFGQLNLSSTSAVTGVVSVSLGGTGAQSFTATGVLFGNGTGAVQVVPVGSANQALFVNAAGTGFNYAAVSLTAIVTGILPIANGGTNASVAATAIINLGGLALNTTGQALTGGVVLTSLNLGTATNSTVTFVAGNPPLHRIILNGTATFVAPSSECEIDLLVTNAGSASSVTFSGYSVGANTGDSFATTSGNKYILMSRTINGSSTYAWKALQ